MKKHLRHEDMQAVVKSLPTDYQRIRLRHRRALGRPGKDLSRLLDGLPLGRWVAWRSRS